jgi:hypothetical protein
MFGFGDSATIKMLKTELREAKRRIKTLEADLITAEENVKDSRNVSMMIRWMLCRVLLMRCFISLQRFRSSRRDLDYREE